MPQLALYRAVRELIRRRAAGERGEATDCLRLCHDMDCAAVASRLRLHCGNDVWRNSPFQMWRTGSVANGERLSKGEIGVSDRVSGE